MDSATEAIVVSGGVRRPAEAHRAVMSHQANAMQRTSLRYGDTPVTPSFYAGGSAAHVDCPPRERHHVPTDGGSYACLG